MRDNNITNKKVGTVSDPSFLSHAYPWAYLHSNILSDRKKRECMLPLCYLQVPPARAWSIQNTGLFLVTHFGEHAQNNNSHLIYNCSSSTPSSSSISVLCAIHIQILVAPRGAGTSTVENSVGDPTHSGVLQTQLCPLGYVQLHLSKVNDTFQRLKFAVPTTMSGSKEGDKMQG